MSLKHGILGLIDYGPMTGYELCKVFNESLAFFWQATTSQVYRELASMEKSGWLTSDEIIQSGKPNKKLYTLTESGRAELRVWISCPLAPSDIVTRHTFLMKLFFASAGERESAMAHLVSFRDMNRTHLEELATSSAIETYEKDVPQSGASVYWALTAQFGLDYYRMCITWADNAIKKLSLE